MQLTIFDLDGTLLSGDSDTLWCRFLIDQGELDGERLRHSAEVAAHYAAGTVVPEDYCQFQASLLRGRSLAALQPLRQRFLADIIRPRIPQAARDLIEHHRRAGDTLLLTTATYGIVSEFTAQDLAVDAYLCTELEWTDGLCSGRTQGRLNIRMGKVDRLRGWLAEHGQTDALLKRATFYSDSINDLALLSVVGRPVVVNPDVRLASTAIRKGWKQLNLRQPRRDPALETQTSS